MSDEAQDVIPEELQLVWAEDVKVAFYALPPKHQQFLLEYLNCWVGAEAYRRVYNELADARVAAAYGSRLLASVNIKKILNKFTDTRLEDLFLIKQTLNDAANKAVKPIYAKDEDGQPVKVEDIEDYDIRVKAAVHLAKLDKLYDADPDDPNLPEKPKTTLSIGGVKIEVS